MAYDTIWEPGNYVFQGDRRAGWDEQWRDWVIEQYGSIAAAEAEWGVAGRRDAQGRLMSPPDEHFRADGPWRTMLAAYRRFMDDLTSSKWNRAHSQLRDIRSASSGQLPSGEHTAPRFRLHRYAQAHRLHLSGGVLDSAE